MKLTAEGKKLTGVSVPVSALRTRKSCGIGELMDLIPLSEWCRQSGIGLIQILPINDTGRDLSPYSALTAFALNPVYLRLEEIEGCGSFVDEINRFRKETPTGYEKVYNFKESILKKIFNNGGSAYPDDWAESQNWLQAYAVFKVMKDRNCSPEEAPGYPLEIRFHIWVQYELDRQLLTVRREMEARGIFLKGDIPILMGEDSADVRFFPEYFDREFTAGAPPDMFSEAGQNWGFPVYDWEKLAEDGYKWWLDRLAVFNRYFHAVRLDHVIGFLRIWRIPVSDIRGSGGHFYPSAFLAEERISEELAEEEIRFLTMPLVRAEQIAPEIRDSYLKDGPEGFLTLKDEFRDERSIENLAIESGIREVLKKIYFTRIFLPVNNGYSPSWYYYKSEYFNSLPEDKKNAVQKLVEEFYIESEELWKINGLKILSEFSKTGDYLLCAEDLGAVPECTAEILESLGILGLKVGRWTRRYHEDGAPFISPEEYPFLSVVTTSVHDSTSLRGWWEEDQNGREVIFSLIDGGEECPEVLTAELAEKIIEFYLGAASFLCILPVQDILALENRYRLTAPDVERINVPGEVNDTNWTYKVPVLLEDLLADAAFSGRIQQLTALRNVS